MNKIKYLLALIVFLATSCEIELKNDDTELPPELTVNPGLYRHHLDRNRHHGYEFQGIHNR